MQAYCLKCKKQQEMANASQTTTNNGRKVMKGNCGNCGTKMNKFLKNN